ncbi:unnamed protein product [Cochlearia groenlandica]
MASVLINENPIVYQKKQRRVRTESSNRHELSREPIDQVEVFDHIKDKKDPEHPYSLESMTTRVMLGNCIFKTKTYFDGILRNFSYFYLLCVDIRVAPGTHETEDAVNKQLNDKERVAAALENPDLVKMVDECLMPSYE